MPVFRPPSLTKVASLFLAAWVFRSDMVAIINMLVNMYSEKEDNLLGPISLTPGLAHLSCS